LQLRVLPWGLAVSSTVMARGCLPSLRTVTNGGKKVKTGKRRVSRRKMRKKKKITN